MLRKLISLLASVQLVVGDDKPTVTLPQGHLVGRFLISPSGKDVFSFDNIPYAVPPEGILRFKAPVEAKQWTGVRDASLPTNICPQPAILFGSTRQSEDCLYLRVSGLKDILKNGGRPVLVIIHAGGFASGSKDLMGPEFFWDNNIIVVAMNYRIGPFGFLSTEDREAPGNYGLLDQTLALTWIRDNIRHFGGDPSSVTIQGISAGGSSVHYHILSPLSKGLFQRAIANSGSSLSTWAFTSHARSLAVRHAEVLNCPTSESKDLVTCMRTKSVEDIIATMSNLTVWQNYPLFAYRPRVDSERDDPFLPVHPLQLMQTGSFNKVPLLIGTCEEEGLIFAPGVGSFGGINHGPEVVDEFFNDFHVVAPAVFGLDEQWPNITELLDFYQHSGTDRKDRIKWLNQMSSDVILLATLDQSIMLMAPHMDSLYRYTFDYPTVIVNFTAYGVDEDKRIRKVVTHGSDAFMLHPLPAFFQLNFTDEDYMMKNLMVSLWSNFVKTGEPTTDVIDIPEWPNFAVDTQMFLRLKLPPSVESHHHKTRMDWWRSLWAKREAANDKEEL